MIVLDTTSATLAVVLGGAVTTNQLPIVASYIDLLLTQDSYTPATNTTQTNNTTNVSAATSPAASTTRHVKFVSIYNADTVSATVTVRLNRSAFWYVVSVTLAVGDTLFYCDGQGWRVMDSTGNLK